MARDGRTPLDPCAVRRIVTLVGDPAWFVGRYDDVLNVMNDPRFGRSHPEPHRASRASASAIFGGPIGDAPSESADHARMRRLLSPVFAARRMTALRPRICQIIDELLDDVLSRTPPVDLHEAISFPLPALVICELLGVPFADREDFRRWSDDAGDTADPERSQAGLLRLWEYMRALAERKRDEPDDAVLSHLLETPHEGSTMSLDEAAMLGAALLFAGHETTVSAIDGGVVTLLTNPGERVALQRDPSLIDNAVEEILRTFLSVSVDDDAQGVGLLRYAKTDVDLGGASVRAGDLVILGLRSANQDGARFGDPERFDHTRSPNPHLTFGHGPRFCLGAPLARIELRAVFDALLRRCPDLTLAVPVTELRLRANTLTGGLVELPVTW